MAEAAGGPDEGGDDESGFDEGAAEYEPTDEDIDALADQLAQSSDAHVQVRLAVPLGCQFLVSISMFQC